MRKDFETLFSRLKASEPAADLCKKIMHRIAFEERVIAMKRKLALFSIILITSVASLFPAFRMAKAEFAESGFMNFLSLLFSDFGEALRSWQSFSLALLESIPIISTSVCLFVLFVFLLFLSPFIHLWTSINSFNQKLSR